MPRITSSKYLVTAGWSDVPHLSEETRQELLAATPIYLRDARSKGTPALGSGAIFPLDEALITCEPFAIPKHWTEIIGLDIGWDHPTAAANIAWDRDSDVIYITKGYKRREAKPVLHAAAIKPWGVWKPVAWPHDALQHDKGGSSCEQIKEQYASHGLNMLPEKATHPEGGNGVEAGLMEMLERMETGRLKVFSNVLDFFAEFRLYHRNAGKIVKEFDDLISAVRYAIMMLRFSIVQPRGRASIPLWKQRIMSTRSTRSAQSA